MRRPRGRMRKGAGLPLRTKEDRILSSHLSTRDQGFFLVFGDDDNWDKQTLSGSRYVYEVKR